MRSTLGSEHASAKWEGFGEGAYWHKRQALPSKKACMAWHCVLITPITRCQHDQSSLVLLRPVSDDIADFDLVLNDIMRSWQQDNFDDTRRIHEQMINNIISQAICQ